MIADVVGKPPGYILFNRAGAEPFTGEDLTGETSEACMHFANVISRRVEPVCDHSAAVRCSDSDCVLLHILWHLCMYYQYLQIWK